MKKLICIMAALVLFSGAAFADLNIKAGIDPYGRGKLEFDKSSDKKEDSKVSGSCAVEYLYPVIDMLRVGLGVEYLFPREIDYSDGPKVSFLPVYATIQVNPIQKYAPGAFVKGNVGYGFLIDLDMKHAKDEEGGIYFAFGTGYEFDFGFFVETTYSFYYGSWEMPGGNDVDFMHDKLGVNIGYKFRI